jgi:hypothetical protein
MESLEETSTHLKEIVRIQAAFRGWRIRNKKMKLSLHKNESNIQKPI